MTTVRVDAAVVGAGTAGAHAALQLARTGWQVALLERGPAEVAGATWSNGILDRQLVRAGLEPSVPPERLAEGGTSHLFGPDGTHAATVASSPTVLADMAQLGRRVRALAADAGVQVHDRVGDVEVEVVGGRPTAVGAGDLRVEARLFVDASGRRGVLRQVVPALAAACPPVEGAELCAAGDYVLEVTDPDGARRFLARHGAQPTEAVNLLGRNGGWSTRSTNVSADLSRVTVLVGCIADGRHGTPARMLAEARAEEPWIGPTVHAATGLIPLRRPYARLTAPGVALVGDAAGQMFPAHGSGIGVGLIAGRMLADAVADVDDPGDPVALWRYAATFHRELGGVLAGYDALRRMSTALGTAGVAAMVRAGLLDARMARDGLDQRWGAPRPRDVPRTALRLARAPRVARTMLPMLARAQLALAWGSRYPEEPDDDALERWDRRMARILGPLPR